MIRSEKPATAALIAGSLLVALLAALLPFTAHAQVKPTVTVVNPVSNPVNTRITNEVVPVTISNADPIPVQVQAAAAGTPLDRFIGLVFNIGANDSSNEGEVFSSSEPVQIVGAALQVSSGETAGPCTLLLSLSSPNGTFLTALASVHVEGGRWLAGPYVPFPNLVLPAGYAINYRLTNSSARGSCNGNFNLQLIRP